MSRHIVVAFLSVMMVSSCVDNRNDSSCYTNMPPEGWVYGDTLVFNPMHPDSVATGDIVLSLRHDNSYQYSNLWVEVTYADGMSRKSDTINVEMCDAYGHWYGHGIGARYQLSDTVVRGVSHVSGAPIGVRHVMRVDTLRGLEQLGVAFVE